MTRTKATAIGAIAILLWSLLAMFTVGSAPVPPFLLNSLTFGIGGLVGLGWIAFSGGFDQLRGVGWKVYAFGSLGLFGYHFLYFSALRLAPAAEAGRPAHPASVPQASTASKSQASRCFGKDKIPPRRKLWCGR
jgi:drug/metabolite transporter (DMT)-like permease